MVLHDIKSIIGQDICQAPNFHQFTTGGLTGQTREIYGGLTGVTVGVTVGAGPETGPRSAGSMLVWVRGR